ncbi:MAG: cadherin-like domain-containing protein, partial [Pseudomonadota bacterium]
ASNGTVAANLDGSFTITPTANFNGAVTLSYNVVDGNGGSVAASQSYTLAAVNDAPTAAPDTAAATEDTTSTGSVAGNDSDIDSPALSYSLNAPVAGLTLAANGSYSFNAGDAAYQSLAAGVTQQVVANYTVSDGSLTATSTLTITVTGTADGPVAAPAVFTGIGDANDFDDLLATSAAPTPQTINDGGGASTLHGSNATDTINGGNGVDTIYGHDGDDVLNGDQAADEVYGGRGIDTITGGTQNDALYGGSGADAIAGNDQVDSIFGGSGNDSIVGGDGGDTIAGGFGADGLNGGVGADTFVFLDLRDTGDTIGDYVAADDTLNFTGIDADSAQAGNQSFVSATQSTTLTAHGLIWFYDSTSNQTIVQGDTDGNINTAEFQVQLNGNLVTGGNVLTTGVGGDFLL